VFTLMAENMGVARRHALMRVMGHKKVYSKANTSSQTANIASQ
jgi:hypothetical protein